MKYKVKVTENIVYDVIADTEEEARAKVNNVEWDSATVDKTTIDSIEVEHD